MKFDPFGEPVLRTRSAILVIKDFADDRAGCQGRRENGSEQEDAEKAAVRPSQAWSGGKVHHGGMMPGG